MRILFTSPATLQICQGRYYNNSIASALQRYQRVADEIILVNHAKTVDSPTASPLPADHIRFFEIEKVNNLPRLLTAKRNNRATISRALAGVDACICHVPSDGGYEVARQARRRGIPTLILPGRSKDIILRAFAGEEVGTWVRPSLKAIPMRKFWLAYKAAPVGRVLVDDGAAQALTQRGKSLLPGGILEVEGSFDKGDLIRIVHQGASLGVGVSNYTADDIRRIKGLKRIEVAAILGDAHYPEVIHRDNMLLDAAI